ncbi:MAG TPA: Rrf2 family transcriptional regulator [Bryobacterales bacterium]|nr:Rrf2 family transcriptional regulator [Bryobacterales bacterium]
MKITALEEYGLRCMLQLAAGRPGESFTVAEIARREGLSGAYVEKLLRILGKAGLAQSLRGVKGGYTLARPSEQITLGDVGRALGGIQLPHEICHRYTGKQKTCVHEDGCSIRPVWHDVTRYVMEMMDSIPISRLLNRADLVQLSADQSRPPAAV